MNLFNSWGPYSDRRG